MKKKEVKVNGEILKVRESRLPHKIMFVPKKQMYFVPPVKPVPGGHFKFKMPRDKKIVLDSLLDDFDWGFNDEE